MNSGVMNKVITKLVMMPKHANCGAKPALTPRYESVPRICWGTNMLARRTINALVAKLHANTLMRLELLAESAEVSTLYIVETTWYVAAAAHADMNAGVRPRPISGVVVISSTAIASAINASASVTFCIRALTVFASSLY